MGNGIISCYRGVNNCHGKRMLTTVMVKGTWHCHGKRMLTTVMVKEC